MYNDNGFGLVMAAMLAFLGIYLVLVAAFYALFAWFLARIFRKAGVAQWKAWVPFYNGWVFFELGGQPGWLALLALIPGASIVAAVFSCIAAYHIGAAFQKPDGGWVVLYIFVPYVWLGIFAFDRSSWNPAAMTVAPKYGSNVPWPGSPQQPNPYASA